MEALVEFAFEFFARGRGGPSVLVEVHGGSSGVEGAAVEGGDLPRGDGDEELLGGDAPGGQRRLDVDDGLLHGEGPEEGHRRRRGSRSEGRLLLGHLEGREAVAVDHALVERQARELLALRLAVPVSGHDPVLRQRHAAGPRTIWVGRPSDDPRGDHVHQRHVQRRRLDRSRASRRVVSTRDNARGRCGGVDGSELGVEQGRRVAALGGRADGREVGIQVLEQEGVVAHDVGLARRRLTGDPVGDRLHLLRRSPRQNDVPALLGDDRVAGAVLFNHLEHA
mmetsp:Transcript_651/g.2283  ORF Transcript_651/g.2283 Transcript_651/m.2283 type:complete len:280 (+) Transcript_651:305-1144(+)